jgi:DNA-binding LytR/AlgR family response regulator
VTVKISFEQDASLKPNEIEVLVRAAQLSGDVTALLTTLGQLENRRQTLPITVDDTVVLLAFNDIVAIEVFGDQLTIHSQTKDYTVRGQLKTMLAKLDNNNFIQISRNSILNLDKITTLAAEFSGNMTARMANGLKLTVSRKYLGDLKQRLGM